MYYSEKAKIKKVKELESNKEFMDYAQEKFEIYKRVSNLNGYDTFEKYLKAEVFNLYENFAMFELLKRMDEKTINRSIDVALARI